MNRIIEKEFLEYLYGVGIVPSEPSYEDDLRRAFYSGVSVALSKVVAQYRNMPVGILSRPPIVDDLLGELNSFCEMLKAGEA